MTSSPHELTIAALSSLQRQPEGPVLFFDVELEALYRAGCVEERPARALVALGVAFRHLDRLVSSAVARRAVL